MRKPEQRLYDTMKRHCANGVRLERIENVVNTGTPDVHATRQGTTCWIELKAVDRPKRLATPLIKTDTLRRDQVAWHLSYASVGGRSLVLVRDDQRQLYVFPGKLVAVVTTFTLAECLQRHAIPRTSPSAEWAQFFTEAFA